MRRTVKAVDLFCGAGGLTHGFELEGLHVAAGVDLDPACAFAYQQNNSAQFIEKDISKISAAAMDGIFGDAKIRVLAGCAPCQPFSTYTQGFDAKSDHKWGLLNQFSRLVRQTTPEIVTMENVPTVAKHSVFSRFVRTLEQNGYQIWHEIVNCVQYGVPQTRRRMVLLASLLGPIELISPTRSKPKTVRQSIGRLVAIEAGGSAARDRLHTASSLSPKNMKRIRASKPGGTWRDWPKSLVAECHQGESGKTYPGVYGRMEWDKPAPTITTQCYGFGNGRFGHPEQNRAISLREAAILQGFPRSYKFVRRNEKVEFTPIGRLIGNAVPVDLGRAIASSILDHIDGVSRKRRPVRGRGTANA